LDTLRRKVVRPLTLAELDEHARALPAEDRARLVESLLESLQEASPPDVAEAWKHEIEARVASYDRGESETFAADDVFDEARRLVE
jgi:putative addiction module component (TIGR02574 family)